MKLLFSTALIALLFCFIRAAVAQNNTDPQADRVLKSVKIKMNGISDLTAKFKYSLDNKLAKGNNGAVKMGVVKLKKTKYRIDFTDQLLICDGKTVWHVMKKENEVNVSDYDPQESFSLDRVFRVYQEDMKARFDRKDRLGGVETVKVSLFPNGKKSDFHRVDMWIDERQNLPVKIKVNGRNGSDVTYELTDVRLNSNLSDTDFVFQKASFPGIQVNDLR